MKFMRTSILPAALALSIDRRHGRGPRLRIAYRGSISVRAPVWIPSRTTRSR